MKTEINARQIGNTIGNFPKNEEIVIVLARVSIGGGQSS